MQSRYVTSDSTAPASSQVAASWAAVGVLFGVLIAASYPVALLAAAGGAVAAHAVRRTDSSSTVGERLFRARVDPSEN